MIAARVLRYRKVDAIAQRKVLTGNGQICHYGIVLSKPANSIDPLPMKLKLLAASILGLIALTSASYGDTVFLDGALTTSDQTFHHPNTDTTGSGVQ